jgi:hypothetical protein
MVRFYNFSKGLRRWSEASSLASEVSEADERARVRQRAVCAECLQDLRQPGLHLVFVF